MKTDIKQIFSSFSKEFIEKRLKEKEYLYDALIAYCVDNLSIEEIAEKEYHSKQSIRQYLKKAVEILQKTPNEKEKGLIDFAKKHLTELTILQKKIVNFKEFCDEAHEEIIEAEKNVQIVGRFKKRKVGLHAFRKITNQHEKNRILLKKDIQELSMMLKNEMVKEGLYKASSQFYPTSALRLYNYYN